MQGYSLKLFLIISDHDAYYLNQEINVEFVLINNIETEIVFITFRSLMCVFKKEIYESSIYGSNQINNPNNQTQLE